MIAIQRDALGLWKTQELTFAWMTEQRHSCLSVLRPCAATCFLSTAEDVCEQGAFFPSLDTDQLVPSLCRCRPYEDCCGSRCCVRALSIQRLWYFWFLLMMGVLFCCGAGFFIRRRMYPPPLIEEPAFNVSYTRQPPNPTAGAQPPGLPYYTDPGGPGMNPAGNPMAMTFQIQPNSPQGSTAYPPPPSYCNTPPPPYEQVVKAK
ncbi:Vesicular, overexpressed in cancer, prosurvival protein 1 [Galemys pyrenaicus]|uniref:WW domain binding protein VOPP1 n=1 Tax=Galemys pyrenaicus TaxID=202257 RepID=A0A8J6DY37_GALPY|nr:Vesicular, overexpressed in cancer, prosurvival protein 1 [Galemys pyrenaicus]